MELFKENFVNASEQMQPLSVHLSGTLPTWLKGNLLRVGPGLFDISDQFTCNHWLDGMAFLYKFSFKDGQVTYSSRYLDTDAYRKAVKAKRPVFIEYGTRSYPDPSKGLFSRMISSFDPSHVTDNVNSNVFQVGDEVFAFSEACYVRRVEPRNLKTKEKVDFLCLAGVNFTTSHPITDESGMTYNLAYSVIPLPKYHIIRTPRARNDHRKGTDPWLETSIFTSIPSRWRASYSYNHSFSLTENYIIFLEQPLLVNTFKLATAQVKGKSFSDCIEWHPEEMVRFIVIDKTTGEMLKTQYFTEEPFFTLHHVNAYEVEDQIVVDLIAYPCPDLMEKLLIEKVRSNIYDSTNPPQLYRFVLPLVNDLQNVDEYTELVTVPNCTASAMHVADSDRGDVVRVHGMPIAEPGFDMPVINPCVRSKQYRYIYGNGGFEQGHYKNAVCKVDVETGCTQLWKGTDYQYASEPTFVPAPYSTSEDDGVLLTVVTATKKEKDFLVVLDARDLSELCRLEVDVPVPNALHGIFIQDDF